MKGQMGWRAAVALMWIGWVCPTPLRAELELQGQVLAPRIWYVNWEFGGIDLNDGPLLMLNYTADYQDWVMQVLGGYGSGWESDYITDDQLRDLFIDPAERSRDNASADRLDIQWQLGRRVSLQSIEDDFGLTFPLPVFFVGVGYHYIEFDFESVVTEAEVFYHGPELMLGASQELPVSGLILRANVTYMPYLWWTVDSSRLYGGSVVDGDTDGILFDVGLAYQAGMLHVAAGYRSMTANEAGQDENGYALFDEDSFAGGYVELGVHW